jgi:hypothetical protein
MTRPDIKSDARRVESAICGGGVAIVQGDVGYGMLAATPDATRRTVSMKHRAAHKRHGMIGNAQFRRDAMKLDERHHDMVDAITVDFDLPLGVIGPVRKDHPIIAGIEPDTLCASMVGDTMAIQASRSPPLSAGKAAAWALNPNSKSRTIPSERQLFSTPPYSIGPPP